MKECFKAFTAPWIVAYIVYFNVSWCYERN